MMVDGRINILSCRLNHAASHGEASPLNHCAHTAHTPRLLLLEIRSRNLRLFRKIFFM